MSLDIDVKALDEPVFVGLPSRQRCGIILSAKRGLDPTVWRNVIEDAVALLKVAMPEADVIGSTLLPLQAELAVQLAHREMGRPFDGVIDVVLPIGANQSRLRAVAPALKAFADRLDLSGCTVNIGEAFYAKAGTGDYAIVQLGYRDPRVNKSRFLAWWTSHHSEFNLETPAGGLMGEYALQHRDDPITSDANNALGFLDDGHVYEPVYIKDIAAWNKTITPEIARGAYDDEKGWFGHDCMRAEITKVIVRAAGVTQI